MIQRDNKAQEKGKGGGLAMIKGGVDASIQLKDSIKKSKVRQNIAANNSTDNLRINRAVTKTRKEKSEEK